MKNTLDESAISIDRAERKLNGSEELVRYLKENVSEQSNQLHEEDASSSG